MNMKYMNIWIWNCFHRLHFVLMCKMNPFEDLWEKEVFSWCWWRLDRFFHELCLFRTYLFPSLQHLKSNSNWRTATASSDKKTKITIHKIPSGSLFMEVWLHLCKAVGEKKMFILNYANSNHVGRWCVLMRNEWRTHQPNCHAGTDMLEVWRWTSLCSSANRQL